MEKKSYDDLTDAEKRRLLVKYEGLFEEIYNWVHPDSEPYDGGSHLMWAEVKSVVEDIRSSGRGIQAGR